MTIEADLRAALLGMSAVTDLVGSDATTARIRPEKLDESDDNTLQHIIIDIDDEAHRNDLQGLGGLVYAMVNVSCRAMEKQDARALAEAVRVNGTTPGTGLAGYAGSATTFSAVLDDETHGIIPFGDGSDRVWHVIECTYICSYYETT